MVVGSIISALGAIGGFMALIGFCPCVLAPIFFVTGPLLIVLALIKDHSIYLVIIGLLLAALGLYLRKRRSCKVHR
ncbi:hypothetical protein COV93_04075 [Candidatus Woesearchaeota archaeon CG11_big_fil_rev_8_21_14_0_20_43_8]|nr:MAG: hypothetical protein COV93_04075 [Candidatus Woesearchaeota archaeon CG11_big_fil_rev_8_21_14_0_20_43_8]PIO05478.1 MAG: hypothetical protein COT47_04550 [Candidatus Woesearchaeota archaeon CG08_land_8_20_14_0_20_43_7]